MEAFGRPRFLLRSYVQRKWGFGLPGDAYVQNEVLPREALAAGALQRGLVAVGSGEVGGGTHALSAGPDSCLGFAWRTALIGSVDPTFEPPHRIDRNLEMAEAGQAS